jgi:nucleoside-diphosphate-sugar epimerase
MMGNSMEGRMPNGIVLVTGASGFIGRALAQALAESGWRVRTSVRHAATAVPSGDVVSVGEISGATDWRAAVAGVDAVVHLAGLAHVAETTEAAAHGAHYRINAEGTESVAKAALAAGVRRFILASSIGVNGTNSTDHAFTAADQPNPVNAYGQSKLAAEQRLRSVANGSAMEWVIVRPPMVYGPEAPGNFARLARLSKSGIPLPVGKAEARRAFVAIDNLNSLFATLLVHPAAANRTFLVRDAEQPTVGELIDLIGKVIDRKPRVLNVPPHLVKMALTAIGRGEDYERLFAPLEIDMTETTQLLGWSPPISMQEGLRRALGGSA